MVSDLVLWGRHYNGLKIRSRPHTDGLVSGWPLNEAEIFTVKVNKHKRSCRDAPNVPTAIKDVIELFGKARLISGTCCASNFSGMAVFYAFPTSVTEDSGEKYPTKETNASFLILSVHPSLRVTAPFDALQCRCCVHRTIYHT